MRLTSCLAATAAWVVLSAGPALGYGLFACYDPAGRQVCLVDTGTMTNFSPREMCTQSCPACAGHCDAVRYIPQRSGRWVETWQGTPGITGDNRLVPGPDAGQDAATIVREGLVAPQPAPPPPVQAPGRTPGQ
jgi:hypothetical protein